LPRDAVVTVITGSEKEQGESGDDYADEANVPIGLKGNWRGSVPFLYGPTKRVTAPPVFFMMPSKFSGLSASASAGNRLTPREITIRAARRDGGA
jgi:hypothetical protein